MEVCIRRTRFKEILLAVKDLEKRGFECVSPIRSESLRTQRKYTATMRK